MTAPRARPGPGTWVLAGVSAAAHLLVGVLYLAAGLVAPLWAVVVLDVVWLLLAVVLTRLALRGSWWTPAVPVVAFASWYGVLTAGEQLLGWTA